MKAIMYHYIREHSRKNPFFVFLHADNFREQLLYFKENYYLPSKEEFQSAISNNNPIDNSIVLTFDDGLSDHYEYVYPILKSLGMWGIFYIPSMPYVSNKLLDVHKVHYLLGKYDSKIVYQCLINIVHNDCYVDDSVERFKGQLYLTQESSSCTKKIKEIINYYIKPSKKSEILEKLFNAFVHNEVEIAKGYYLNRNQIDTMAKDGMVIASHSHSHTLLSNLSKYEQEFEVGNSLEVLREMSPSVTLNTFCFPYGGSKSYNEDTLEILNKNNIKYAFSVESRDIEKRDLKNSPFELPRYDCNEFPYGRAENFNL